MNDKELIEQLKKYGKQEPLGQIAQGLASDLLALIGLLSIPALVIICLVKIAFF